MSTQEANPVGVIEEQQFHCNYMGDIIFDSSPLARTLIDAVRRNKLIEIAIAIKTIKGRPEQPDTSVRFCMLYTALMNAGIEKLEQAHMHERAITDRVIMYILSTALKDAKNKLELY